MKSIEPIELVMSQAHINDMKTVVGSDLILDIYISPGGEPHTAWDDEAQERIKTVTKKPTEWQYQIVGAESILSASNKSSFLRCMHCLCE